MSAQPLNRTGFIFESLSQDGIDRTVLRRPILVQCLVLSREPPERGRQPRQALTHVSASVPGAGSPNPSQGHTVQTGNHEVRIAAATNQKVEPLECHRTSIELVSELAEPLLPFKLGPQAIQVVFQSSY